MLIADDLLQATPACVHFVDESEIETLIADERLDQFWIHPEPVEHSLLLAVADAIAAPDWFGENWDAIEECLGDLDDARAQVLVVRGAKQLWRDVPLECGALVETWLTVSESRTTGFHLVFAW
jgi:hypothetical protein